VRTVHVVRASVLFVLVAILVALGGAACGATEEGEDGGPTLAAGQVARQFEQETGRTLEEAAGTDQAWEQLSFGLDPPAELVQRFGIFSVYVVEPGNDEAVGSLLSDKATGKPLEPDEQGVYWERDSQSGTWTAYTRYGENVVLAWFSERKVAETDERWARLDRVLSDLES
jgi:hypothetical protein